jgi:hypothetical protein
MLIPKHCSNPNCHRPYLTPEGKDIYSEVLVKISTESDVRVISVCTKCRDKYDKKMAEDIMRDVVPEEVKRITDDILISFTDKVSLLHKFEEYKIEKIGRNIDEMK